MFLLPAVFAFLPVLINTCQHKVTNDSFPDTAANHWVYEVLNKSHTLGLAPGYRTSPSNRLYSRFEIAILLVNIEMKLDEETLDGDIDTKSETPEEQPASVVRRNKELLSVCQSLRKVDSVFAQKFPKFNTSRAMLLAMESDFRRIIRFYEKAR